MISKKHLGVGAGIGVLAIIFGLTYMPQPQNGAVTVPNPVGENIPDNTSPAPANDVITEESVPAVVTTIAPSESQEDNTSDNVPVVNTFPIELPTPTDTTPGVTYSSHPHHSSGGGGGGSSNNEDNNSSGDNNNEDIPPILVIPESPIGLIALFGSSLATLGAYLFYQRSH